MQEQSSSNTPADAAPSPAVKNSAATSPATPKGPTLTMEERLVRELKIEWELIKLKSAMAKGEMTEREMALRGVLVFAEAGHLPLDAGERQIMLAQPPAKWTPRMREVLKDVNDHLADNMKLM